MPEPSIPDAERLRTPGLAYLLSVVGGATSQSWKERMGAMGLHPRDVVVLRMVAADPGRSQGSLAPALRVRPSFLVRVVDRLQKEGLLERRPHPEDRRAHALHLTARGRRVLARVMTGSTDHEEGLVGHLSTTDRAHLERILLDLARRLELPVGGHPGFESKRD